MNEPAAATAAGTSGARFERAFLLLAGGDDVRLCKDIPDSACREQPGNFFRHLLAALGNKLADEIASARLVLPWLLAQLGAGGAAVGWLVPQKGASSTAVTLDLNSNGGAATLYDKYVDKQRQANSYVMGGAA
ncbi:MAG TPA: hypothetical protein PKW88_15895, partial [Plasticicumulans sp.]|nr:hypothetical protein [Plasticicumulans sp.]